MIQITCKGNSAICTRTDRLTSGMVGLQCEFVFDGAWDGLARTAVFWAGNEKRDVLLTGDTCTVPWEVLKTAGYQLVIGVYGTNAEGTLVIPTVYAMCGGIASGADPSGDESVDPTLPIWGQIQGMIGDLAELATASKDNLVDAINEAAKSGGGSAVELDTTLSEAGKAADAKAVGDALAELEAKEETDPTVPEWAKAATKPSYTAEEVGARPADWMPTAAEVGALPATYTPPDQTAEQVGADPVGTAAAAVSGHNTNNGSHADIRLLIEGLTTRLNALANSTDEDLDQMAELVAYIKSNKSLIDGITTSKVSVADIVDNLTTNVSNKPLSAAQGVALKELIDALSNSMTAYRTAAAQDVIDSGKVDKVTGKGLSSNDYTATAKAKVDAIPENPKYTDTVYDDTALKERVATIEGKESAWDAKSDFSGSYNDLTDKPTIPTALPNPNALTIKIGSTTITYDGSAAKTVEIADGSEVSY